MQMDAERDTPREQCTKTHVPSSLARSMISYALTRDVSEDTSGNGGCGEGDAI